MRTLRVAVVLAMLFSLLAGCGTQAQTQQAEDQVVTACMSAAQIHINNGDYDAAISVLEEGIGMVNSPKLTQMLEEVKQKAAAQAPTATENVENTQQEETQPTVPSEPVVTEPVESEALLKDNQRKINVFLSNFAESYFDEYPCNDYSLLSFGRVHYSLNDWEKVYSNWEEDYEYVKKSDMDRLLKDFFGKTVTPKDDYVIYYDGSNFSDEIVYMDDGYYYYEVGYGEFYDYVAIAKAMVDNGDGTYTVAFDIYAADVEEGLDDSDYSYTAEKAARSSKLDRCKTGTAVVKEHTRSTGKESYQLIEYKVRYV